MEHKSVAFWLFGSKQCLLHCCVIFSISFISFLFSFFFQIIKHLRPLHRGQRHSKQCLWNGKLGSISSQVKTLQIPAGLRAQHHSCPLRCYSLVMPCRIIWSQPETFQAKERFPAATGPSVCRSYALPSRPGKWQRCGAHIAWTKLLLTLRMSRMVVTHDVPVMWK